MRHARGTASVFAVAVAATLAVPVFAADAASGSAATTASSPPAIAAAIAAATSESSLLVGVAPDASTTTQDTIAQAAGASQAARVAPSVLQVQVAAGTTEARAAQLHARPDVRYVEANTAVHTTATPNDPGYPIQWGLQDGAPGIGTPTAWNHTKGSASVVVGVLDTGADLTHADLAANLWTNPGGVGGCPAGTHGVNEVDGGCVPQDGYGHGSHVAGIIGAVGNNDRGVTGVNWTTSLMPLRVLDDNGSGTIADVIAGIEFAVQAKLSSGVNVRVLNASFSDDGESPPSDALRSAIQDAGSAGILVVVAAGNNGRNLDLVPEYPCSFRLANQICVAATSDSPADTLWGFSNYSATGVDIAAPGTGVVSTWIDGGYASAYGTSMAAPHVAGAAALMLADTNMSMGTLKSMLLTHDAPIPALRGRVATGGRLDVGCAVGATMTHWCAWDAPAPALSGGLASAPALASWAPGRLDAFARTTGGQLTHTWSTGTFARWENLGGGLVGAPAAISWSAGRLDVFARGTDNQLWHRWYDGRWSGWEPLGGSLSSAPTVASWFPGRLDVFARGTDNQLWHRWYDGRWSGWEPLGGSLGGDPGAVSWGLGRIDVAARGSDGQVWHRWYGGGWAAWEPLGGTAVGGTAVSSRGPGTIDIFIRGTDGHLWHKWNDGAWHGYEDLGGSLTSGPAAVSRTSSRIDIVGRSSGNQLTRVSWRQ